MEYFIIIANAISQFFKGFGFNNIASTLGGIDWDNVAGAIMKVFDTVVDVVAG